ncbi:gamma-glutamylcyclotransferase family protein [Agrococcus sp. SGAir0287]|uniref:gamma-glutamylcyclotransferase family protein n=1 Tax=Agrococcus sp. SGAir0287 TaxID=2070347 RepID=UPI0020C7590C|nr:gamma-glutamylcyclotransferase family protein [Agrococcus sp. SGAir0287]
MTSVDGFAAGGPTGDEPLLDQPGVDDDAARTTHDVFSFGTLRQGSVQQAIYGGPVPTVPDSLVGWRLTTVRITDPAVIAASGSDEHPGIERSGDPADRVDGGVLTLDDGGLAATDRYESVGYERTSVVLASGREAWIYVPRPGVDA